MILNNSDEKYYIKFNNKALNLGMIPDAACYLQEGKIKIVSIVENEASSAKNLKVGEEIKSIDGRNAESFLNECQFLNWRLLNSKNPEYKFEKMEGEIVTIKRQMLKTEN